MLKRLVTIACGLLATLQVSAGCCEPGLEYGGEFLALRPSVCDEIFVIKDPRPFVSTSPGTPGTAAALPQKTFVAVEPDYSIGFRLYAANVFCGGCYDIRFAYTHLYSNQFLFVLPVAGGGLWPTDVDPVKGMETPLYDSVLQSTFSTGKLLFDYDAGDVEVASRGGTCRGTNWRTFAGIHIAVIDQQCVLKYAGTNDPGGTETVFEGDVKFRSKAWGTGPRIGAQFQRDLLCGLGVSGRIGLGLLAGEAKGTTSEVILTTLTASFNPVAVRTSSSIDAKDRAHLFPELDARLGLTYRFCLCRCLQFTAEAGYEFTSYVNVLSRTIFNDERGTTQSDCFSFNLNGFYAGLKVQI